MRLFQSLIHRIIKTIISTVIVYNQKIIHEIHIINNQTPCNIQVYVILDKHKPHISMKAESGSTKSD